MDTEDSKKNLYFGGVPTAPFVNKIVDAIPSDELKPGVAIHYDKLSAIVNVPVNSSRFRTIVLAWRKRMAQEHNLIIGPPDVADNTLVVFTESAKVGLAERHRRGSIRKARKSLVVSGMTDRLQLTEEEKKRLDLNLNRASAILLTGQLRGPKELPQL